MDCSHQRSFYHQFINWSQSGAICGSCLLVYIKHTDPFLYGQKLSCPLPYVAPFTTRPPAVTDVFDSGRKVAALHPTRRVGFR